MIPSTDYYHRYLEKRIHQRGGAALGDYQQRFHPDPLRYKFKIFRGRGGCGGRATAYYQQEGEGLLDLARRLYPLLKRIPDIFKSKVARKIAGTVAATGAATGINILSEKLANRAKPFQTIAKEQGTRSGQTLLDAGKQVIEKHLPKKMQGGRRHHRKPIKRIATGHSRTTTTTKRKKQKGYGGDVFDGT